MVHLFILVGKIKWFFLGYSSMTQTCTKYVINDDWAYSSHDRIIDNASNEALTIVFPYFILISDWRQCHMQKDKRQGTKLRDNEREKERENGVFSISFD